MSRPTDQLYRIAKDDDEGKYEEALKELVDKMFPKEMGEALHKVLHPEEGVELTEEDYQKCAFVAKQFSIGVTYAILDAEQRLKLAANTLERAAIEIKDDNPRLSRKLITVCDEIEK